MSNAKHFRPRSGLLFGGMSFTGVFITLYLQLIDYGFNLGFITASLWGAWICSVCFQIFIYPKVIFFDEAIKIVNPFSTYLIGWQDIEQIETRYTMSVRTFGDGVPTKQIYAFAAPAPGRYHGRNIHQSELRGLSIHGAESIRAGQSPRTHSGVASAIANQKLTEFRRVERVNHISYRHQFNKGALFFNLALFIPAVALFVIHN